MDFKDAIYKRRSVNFFDPDKNISDELLKKIINLAAITPSSFNLQPWSVIALRDKGQKLKLQELAWNQPKVSEAPVTLIILADRTAWMKGHPYVEKNFKEMVNSGAMTDEQYDWFIEACAGLYGTDVEKQTAFAAKNAGFFAMSLMLAAKSLGLDSHPMDGFDHDGVRKAFNIPDHYWVPLLLAIGYFRSDKELLSPKWRKTYDEIVVNFD